MNCRWVFWLDPFFLLLVLDNLVSVNHEIAAGEHTPRAARAASGLGGAGSYTWGAVEAPSPHFTLSREEAVLGGWGGSGIVGICRFEIGSCLSFIWWPSPRRP